MVQSAAWQRYECGLGVSDLSGNRADRPVATDDGDSSGFFDVRYQLAFKAFVDRDEFLDFDAGCCALFLQLTPGECRAGLRVVNER